MPKSCLLARSRWWLLLPLALHLVSMLLLTYDEMPGWAIWYLNFVAALEDANPINILGAIANVSFALALPALIFSRERPRLRLTGALMALGAFAAALPIGAEITELLVLPGYWVWTGSFAALAVLAGPLAGYVGLWKANRSPSLLVESARAAGMAAPGALFLCGMLCPRAAGVFESPFVQIVPPGLAAAGTVALVCFMAALGWRLRRPLQTGLPGGRRGPPTQHRQSQERRMAVREGERHHDLALRGVEGA